MCIRRRIHAYGNLVDRAAAIEVKEIGTAFTLKQLATFGNVVREGPRDLDPEYVLTLVPPEERPLARVALNYLSRQGHFTICHITP